MDPLEWTSGGSKYRRESKDGVDYAVLEGKTVDDRQYVFMIKKDKQKRTYFVHAATRNPAWELPDLVAADEQASKGPQLTIRERVTAIYQKYCPEKLGNVDKAVESYAGHEDQLIALLVEKYGPEPTPSEIASNSSSVAPPATQPSPTPNTANTATKPAASNQRSYRDRVVAIYTKYKPAKLGSVDKNLEQYKGQEEALIEVLVKKFGPEPEAEAAATQPHPQEGGDLQGSMSQSPPATPQTTAQANPTEPTSPKPAPVDCSYRDRVTAIYQKYKPNKVNSVDKLMGQYAGQEEFLIKSLVEKFGPEPEPETITQPQPTPQADSVPKPVAEAQDKQQENQESQPVNEAAQPAMAPEKSQPREQPTSFDSQPSSTFDFGGEDGTTTHSPRREPEQQSPPPTQSSRSIGHSSNAGGSTSPQSAAPSASPASPSAGDNAGSQEQLLVTFIQDRDDRLRAAQTRSEQYTAALDELRQQNAKLSKQLSEIKNQTEMELQGMKAHSTKLEEETAFAKAAWELEREKLAAQADVAKIVAEKTVHAEKVKYEEDRAAFHQEQSQLKEAVARLEAEVATKEKKAGTLLETLDAKDAHLRKLNRELEDLKHKLKPKPSHQVATQTAETEKAERGVLVTMDDVEQQVTAISNSMPGDVSPSPDYTNGNDEDDALFAEYDALVSAEKVRQDDVDKWRRRAKDLEREVSRLRNALSAPQVKANCTECSRRTKVILALRNKAKTLEEKVADLELSLLAQPSDLPNVSTESNINDKLQMESAVNALKQELAEARTAAKTQKREIADLRGLLSMHMSNPTGGLRAALGADKAKTPTKSTPAPKKATTPTSNKR